MTQEFILPETSGLHFSLNVLWWWQPLYYFCTPVIEIDGVAQSAKWGKQTITLTAGHYQVRVYFPYLGMKQCGLASVDVSLSDTRGITLKYTPPFTVFQPGKIRITQG